MNAELENSFYAPKENNLPEGLKKYCNALEKTGFSHLSQFLNREKETTLLKKAKQSVIKALDSQPRPPRNIIDILALRDEIRRIQKEGTNPFDFPLRFISPEKLWGISECYPEENPSLTDVGKVLYKIMEKYPDLSIFITGGGAGEGREAKPWITRRDFPTVGTFNPQSINSVRIGEDLTGELPSADIDLLLVNGDNPLVNLDTVAEFVNKDCINIPEVEAFIKKSGRREGFERTIIAAKGFVIKEKN